MVNKIESPYLKSPYIQLNPRLKLKLWHFVSSKAWYQMSFMCRGKMRKKKSLFMSWRDRPSRALPFLALLSALLAPVCSRGAALRWPDGPAGAQSPDECACTSKGTLKSELIWRQPSILLKWECSRAGLDLPEMPNNEVFPETYSRKSHSLSLWETISLTSGNWEGKVMGKGLFAFLFCLLMLELLGGGGT